MTREPHFIPTARYGEDSDLSFGQLLAKCLSFPMDEIEIDIANSEKVGTISPETRATSNSIATAVAAKGKQDTAVRLHTERRRAARDLRPSASPPKPRSSVH